MVRLQILIAQAQLKPRDSSVIKSIEKIIGSSKDADERMQAIVAAGSLEKRKAILSILARGLADASPSVRRATAYIIARRRDRALLGNVRIVRENEQDDETKALLVATDKAIAGASLEAFSKIREKLTMTAADR